MGGYCRKGVVVSWAPSTPKGLRAPAAPALLRSAAAAAAAAAPRDERIALRARWAGVVRPVQLRAVENGAQRGG